MAGRRDGRPDARSGRRTDGRIRRLCCGADCGYGSRARGRRRSWPPIRTATAARIRTTLAAALAAHYEFESARPAQVADLPPPRTPHIPPAALTEFRLNPFSGPPPRRMRPPSNAGGAKRRLGTCTAQLQRRGDVVARHDVGHAPGRHPRPLSGPACAAKPCSSTKLTGVMGRDVGYYDRTDPFTLDFWFYAAAAYETYPYSTIWPSRTRGARAIDSRSRTASSGRHSHTPPPANMIAIETEVRFPSANGRISRSTYNGSSRAGRLTSLLERRTGRPRPYAIP